MKEQAIGAARVASNRVAMFETLIWLVEGSLRHDDEGSFGIGTSAADDPRSSREASRRSLKVVKLFLSSTRCGNFQDAIRAYRHCEYHLY